MIYYFSATGNSKHAAQVIAEKTGDTAVSIVDIIKGKTQINEKSEKTGFVFPVYFWGLPEIIKRFSSMPEVKNSLGDYVYCVITCGATTGSADKMLAKSLGRKLDYSFSLRMPDNYVVMYDPSPKEKAQKFLAHADKELETVCADINASAKKRAGSTKGKVKSIFISKLYNAFRSTKNFYANDKCVSCGICAKNCPDSAIEIKNGKPVWIKSKCQHCTACINCCPTEAIQYGNGTESRRRYSYDKTVNK
ncbi:MAG: EFR1 family ferrodoxin [Clostridia bacterium]|nr:EFR1 family ferrodoxin [Clostridia bacterium]